MTYSLASYLTFIQAEYNQANSQPNNTVGAFAHAYEFIFALISRDSQGREILRLDGSGNLIDRDNNIINLSSWSIDDEPDHANWSYASGVDAGSWAFLRGVPDVNNNDGDYSAFIRAYTKAQYLTRTGTVATDAQVQQVSNGIARNIMQDILANNLLPTVSAIAVHDASAAAEALFGVEQIAGWAGNPLFLFLGHSGSFNANILEQDGNAYDLLSVFKCMIDAGCDAGFTTSELIDLLVDTWQVASIANAASTIGQALTASNNFFDQTYGDAVDGYDSFLSALSLLDIKLGRGGSQSDSIILDEDSEFIHAGGGNDYIKGSLTAGVDRDIIDGGDGIDHLDFSHISADVELGSNTNGYRNFALEIDRANFIGDLFSTSYAYNIERLSLGSGDDKVDVKLTSGSTLQRLDTNGGDDEMEIELESYGGPGNYSALRQVNTGEGDDVVEITGGANPELVVNLGGGDDTLKSGVEGMVVYGNGGADRYYLSNNVMVMDADADDRISAWGQRDLTGGVRNENSESPWAYGLWGDRYAINTDGELVIADWLGNQMFINQYNNTIMGGNFNVAGILVGTLEWEGYRLLETPDKNWFFNTWKTLMGTALKALTGVSYFNGVDPLVLDLDGDGLELTARSSFAPYFDIDGDGFAEQTGWVAPDDGILVFDINGNGLIDDVSELFGNATRSGFDMLADYDENNDGFIDSDDSIYSKLRIWQDLNGNGIADEGELNPFDKIISFLPTTGQPMDDTIAGNDVIAVAQFMDANGGTSNIYEVVFDANQRDTRWLGDHTISQAAVALPEVKGYGTIYDLRIAMTDSASLLSIVTQQLSAFNTLNLADMRQALTPVLNAWAAAIPVPVGTPGLETHIDVPILAKINATGAEVFDFAYKVEDAQGEYWRRGSGQVVKDAQGHVIARPTFEQVMEQVNGTEGGEWQLFTGAQIQFLERYFATPLPIGVDNLSSSASVDGATTLLSQMWGTLNEIALRIAMQGPLAPYFPDIKFNAENDSFEATTDRQLVPMFEAILDAAPDNSAGAQAYLQQWKPLLGIFMQDFDRGADYLQVSYAFLFQNLIAAYENVGLATTLTNAAAALDIPVDLIRTGTGIVNGGTDADLFYLGAGDQTAQGGNGPDSYIVGHNWGHDVINDVEQPLNAAPDMLRFAHLNADDVTMHRDGLDLVITETGTNNELRIINQFTTMRYAPLIGNIDPDYGIREIVFANGVVWDRLDIAKAAALPFTSGDDTLVGTNTIDFLDGGAGNDFLEGRGEGDVYRFGIGDGHDTILDNIGYVHVDTPDILQFKPGITINDLTFVRQGASNNLTIKINGTQDQVTITDQFLAAYTGPLGTQWLYRIEALAFDNGFSINWQQLMEHMVEVARTAGNDTIYGFSWEDVLDGGAGNDYLSGGNEDDTYIMGLGYGHDTIEDNRGNIFSGATDTVKFRPGITPQDVALSRDGGSNDVTMTLQDGSSLLIKDQFSLTYGLGVYEFDRIERFEFADGTVWTYEEVMQRLLDQYSTGGNDTIHGFMREDTIEGGTGNDYMAGGDEGDTYIYNLGDGNDIIYDFHDEFFTFGTNGNIDTLQLIDINPSDVSVLRTGGTYDMVLRINSTGHTITLKDQELTYNNGSNFNRIERVAFANGVIWGAADLREQYLQHAGTSGNDSIIGFFEADTLDGGAGNDRLEGDRGGDTYRFGIGHGHDTIYDYYGYADQPDTIAFGTGITPADITATRVGENLVLGIVGTSDQLTIEYQFTGGSGTRLYMIERFVFADGTVWNESNISTLLTLTTNGNDHVVATALSETINGMQGNDILEGKEGGDTYIYALGDGNDTIIEDFGSGDTDILQLGAGLTEDKLHIERVSSNGHVNLTFNGEQGSVLINDQLFGVGNYGVEQIAFNSGAIWNRSELVIGGNAAETLNADAGNNKIFAGAGSDTIHGNGGNDLIYGDAGDDLIYGDNGVDIIIGGAGKDTMSGGTGADIFRFLSLAESNNTDYDLISDFTQGQDKLDVAALGFTGLESGGSPTLGHLGFYYSGGNTFVTDGNNFTFALAGTIALTEADLIHA